MLHTAQGWWLHEAGAPPALPALEGPLDADVVIVGGGFTGLWCAWRITELDPGCRVVLVDRDRCGHGPSGRNGGFCKGLWLNLPALVERFGDAGALAVGHACEDAVGAIGRWCADEGVDAWFRHGGFLCASTTPAHDDAHAPAVAHAQRLGVADRVVALGADEVQARCAAPRLRRGVLLPDGATVQPARLALGLRTRLLTRGVAIHEQTPVLAVHETADGVRLTTPRGEIRASRAVLAAGPALAALPPLRRRLTVASSHALVTAPIPDVLAALGWQGGEAITDAQYLLHYMRATPDGRVVFGWAGGRPGYGARLGGRVEVDREVVARTADGLLALLPGIRRDQLEHAWGGPIDITPGTLPTVTPVGPRVDAAYGFTGRGVGPTRLVGEILAARALGAPDDRTALPLVSATSGTVPPEPLRWVGATIVRSAILRRDDREVAGEPPGRLTGFVAGLPQRLGMTLGR